MSAYGGASLDVVGNFTAGARIFAITKENLSIPVGEEINVPIVLTMRDFSKYYLFYIIDQDVSVTVDWFNSSERGFMREKTIALSSSSPDGTFLEGRVQAGKIRVNFTNNGVGNITEIYIAVFGIR